MCPFPRLTQCDIHVHVVSLTGLLGHGFRAAKEQLEGASGGM